MYSVGMKIRPKTIVYSIISPTSMENNIMMKIKPKSIVYSISIGMQIRTNPQCIVSA